MMLPIIKIFEKWPCHFFYLGLLLLYTNLSFGQSKEVGAGFASFNYTGDINPSYQISNQTIGAYINYSKNFEKGWAAKLMLAAGKLKGQDVGNKDALSGVRDAGFNDFITEMSLQFQYEFLDFRKSPLVNFSPYLGAGAGFLLMNRAEKISDYSDIQLMLPLSVGVKYSLGPLWTINLEFSARKTFYDYLDNISEEEVTDKRNTNFLFGNWSDNDWYYFLGIGINYTFWQVNCPVPLAK